MPLQETFEKSWVLVARDGPLHRSSRAALVGGRREKAAVDVAGEVAIEQVGVESWTIQAGAGGCGSRQIATH